MTGGAVGVPLALHRCHHALVPSLVQAEVQKAGAGNLRRGKVAPCQVHVVQQGLGNLLGRLAQQLTGRQGKGGGEIAVGGIFGNLHRCGLDLRLGQRAVPYRGLIGAHGQRRGLVLRVLDHVDHIIFLFC